MTWKPHLTVAAVIEKDDQFLMVEEYIDGVMHINQPAGHLEPDECLIDAVIRETLEETAWHFKPEFLIGIYQWQSPTKTTFLRFTFGGSCISHDATRTLDPDIHRAVWMNQAKIESADIPSRSPIVTKCIQDYIDGHRYPLSILTELIRPSNA